MSNLGGKFFIKSVIYYLNAFRNLADNELYYLNSSPTRGIYRYEKNITSNILLPTSKKEEVLRSTILLFLRYVHLYFRQYFMDFDYYLIYLKENSFVWWFSDHHKRVLVMLNQNIQHFNFWGYIQHFNFWRL